MDWKTFLTKLGVWFSYFLVFLFGKKFFEDKASLKQEKEIRLKIQSIQKEKDRIEETYQKLEIKLPDNWDDLRRMRENIRKTPH